MKSTSVRNRQVAMSDSGIFRLEDRKAPRVARAAAPEVTFMNVALELAAGVVTPRLETELLVAEALARLEANPQMRSVVDMCCGCGAIALALAMHHPDIQVWACDLLEPAVEVTHRNVRRHGLERRVRVVRGDLFSALGGAAGLACKVDLVVSNPPYISTSRLESEKSHLLESEPREAFDGGPYGLTIHQRLIREAPGHLVDGGWLVFEFGHGQERQVGALIRRQSGYAQPLFACDRQGFPRVAAAQWRG